MRSDLGQRIGPYQVVRELGHGGMGSVYLATRADAQYRKQVAIKLIKRGMDTDFVLRRFRNERQILASLDHPNIAKLLDGGATEDGLPYLVMEFIEGQPMDEYCDAHKLSTAERLKLFRAVCAAVHYAHQNLVIHRDLKPGNILVTTEGVPKLLDFGIAKLLNPALLNASAPAATAARMMTPEYASPEQARGEPITTASDIYSLGVLLYELLTGHQPYRLQSYLHHEILRIVCEEEPSKPSTAVTKEEVVTDPEGVVQFTVTPESVSRTREGQPEKLRRRLAGDLDNIVMMALRKEPQRRYASVEQFSEDIRRHLEGLPVIARPNTLGYLSTKFIQRNKAGVIAAALILLTLVAGLVATAWQARVARVERAKAERRFNDVRKLANSLMFELHDAIEKLPGSTSAQALLVKRALEYLDSLASEAQGDLSLQRELATAYEKVGEIQGNPYSANLGDTAGAMESYRKALAIREALSNADPQNAEARRELATNLDHLGDIQEQGQDLKRALASYRQALQIREALLAQDPANALIRRDVARSYEYIGEISAKTGDAKGGLENFRQSLAICEALSAQAPTDAPARRSLAVMRGKVSEALAEANEMSGALEQARQSLASFEALATADPNNVKAKRELAMSYNKLGDLLWSTNELTGALDN